MMLEDSPSGKTGHWGITRLANACAIVEIDGARVLTDPWFQRNDRFFTEYSPIQADELPEMDAIIGGHWVNDHWNTAALKDYRHKETTPVYVSDKRMAKKARKVGFRNVERLPWGETREITKSVTLEAIEEHVAWGRYSSNYGLYSEHVRLFVATEALDVDAARRFGARSDPMDVVIGPVNGVHLMGRQLTVTAAEMIEITRVLKAPTFVVFHDSHKPLWKVIRIASSAKDLAAVDTTGIDVIELPVGQRFTASAA